MNEMKKTLLGLAVASGLLAGLAPIVAIAQPVSLIEDREAKIDELFVQLADPETVNPARVANRIMFFWSQSGSASADLLLERGREALDADDYVLAIEHLTALTDHAPDFAEGWNARATAFYLADEYGLALHDIQIALSLNPRHFGAMSGLALILEELGDEENALKVWREVELLHPRMENLDQALERLQNATLGRTL